MIKKLKKIISVIMVVVMCFAMSPMDGFVGLELFDFSWFKVSATYEGFVYEVLNGTYCSITGYTGSDTEVVIPLEIEGYIVQRVENSAFKNNTTIEKVVFSETVETMGNEVFRGCTNLTYVGLNSGLKSIGEYTFYGCTSLKEYSVPLGTTSIGNYAFYGCTALSKVEISASVKSLGNYAFGNCTALIDGVTLNEGLISIADDAFNGCTNLEEIVLPDSVTTLGYNVFYNCQKLTSINIPQKLTTCNSYTYYGHGTFRNTGITSVVIPEGMTTIPAYTFYNCTTLESVVLPDSVTTIGNSAFEGCSSLKTAELNENLTTIGNNAFSGCSSLESVQMPESLETIGNYAFNGCSGLKTVNLNDGLKTIGERAFYGCSALKEVEIPASTATLNSYCEDHSFSDWTIDFEATCQDEGIKTRSCSVCGYEETEFTNTTGHTEKTINKIDATCSESGYTGDVICEVCNETITVGEVIEAYGHIEITDEGVEATCTSNGLTSGSHCERCGEVLLAQEVIVSKGHNYDAVVTDPSCNEGGFTINTCAVCGDSYISDETAKLGHSGGEANCKDKAVCGVCGESYGELDADNHKNVITDKAVPATCLNVGLTEGKKCSVCGTVLIKQREIPKLGHNMSEYVVTKSATCTENGTEVSTCSRCTYSETKTISANGHSYSNGVCQSCGDDKTVVCSCNCHKTGISKIIFKILLIFQKIFKKNKQCACGINHY